MPGADFGRILLTGRKKTDVRLLLEYDADINVHGGDGDTPYNRIKVMSLVMSGISRRLFRRVL